LDTITLPHLIFQVWYCHWKDPFSKFSLSFSMCCLILHFGLYHFIFVVFRCIFLIVLACVLRLSCISLFAFLLLYLGFKFFRFYCCAPRNMATFHVVGRSNLTIMVNDSSMIFVLKHCLCYVCFPSKLFKYIEGRLVWL
jgi:hypothetical protein